MANVYVNDIIKRHPENQEQYVVEAIDIQGLFEYLKTHITLNNHELEVKDGKLNIVVDNETKTYTITFDYNGATYKGTQKLPATTTSETISRQSGNQLGYLPELSKRYNITWNNGGGNIQFTSNDGDQYVEHTLSGWYTLKTGGTQINSSTIVTENKTYYARYNQVTGTLTTPNTSNLKYIQDINFYDDTTSVEPIKAVANFSGWDHDLSKSSIDNDLIITAQYYNTYRSKQKPNDLTDDTGIRRFMGWATTEGGNPVNFEKDSEDNFEYTSTEYYAIWEPIPSEENLYWYFGTTKLTTDEEIQTNGTSISSKDEIPNSLDLVDPEKTLFYYFYWPKSFGTLTLTFNGLPASGQPVEELSNMQLTDYTGWRFSRGSTGEHNITW